jgi:LmbE family N-acetylglucosaminyl deacetylase
MGVRHNQGVRKALETVRLPRRGAILTLLACGVLAAALLAAWPRTSATAATGCEEKRMYFDAHQDDDLLFQSPRLIEDLEDGNCVRTVFLTAGDAGQGESYWHGREEGSRAAYAAMAGVGDEWTAGEPVVDGHKIPVQTLDEEPQVSQVYLRLPDGKNPGTGYPSTGEKSLAQLWHSQHAEAEIATLPSITQITAIDGSNTYTYEGLISTLAALIEEFEPDGIAIQDAVGKFGEGDHSDHVAGAKLVRLASASYKREHALRSYMDYNSRFQTENVFGSQLTEKVATYFVYAAHDPKTCSTVEQCDTPPLEEYGEWFKRQIVLAKWSVPGADAGPDLEVKSGAEVFLNGSNSTDPLDKSLGYEWTQTAGPAVTLHDPDDIHPGFRAPVGPATLEFELVVDNGEASSQPATTTVAVAAPPEEEEEEGEGEKPKGGKHPEKPATQKRPEVRPANAAEVTVRLTSGLARKRLIRVVGDPVPFVECRGKLPAGIGCRVRRDGNVVVSSSHRNSPRGTYRARVVASNSAGTVSKAVRIVVAPNPRALRARRHV